MLDQAYFLEPDTMYHGQGHVIVASLYNPFGDQPSATNEKIHTFAATSGSTVPIFANADATPRSVLRLQNVSPAARAC